MRNKSNFKRLNNKGFTLIEVLIVVIIIAVLAGLAVPIFRGTVEKSRKAEALGVLSALRASELRYFAANDTFTTTMANLDYNPAAADTSGQTVHFTYTVPTGAATLSCRALRNAVDGGDGTSTVLIDQAGVVTGTGVFA